MCTCTQINICNEITVRNLFSDTGCWTYHQYNETQDTDTLNCVKEEATL